MLSRFLKYLNERLFLIWLLLFSLITIAISPEAAAYYTIFSTFILFYLIYLFNRTLFYCVIIFVTITLSLYYPISLQYGSLNSGIIAAFFETNLSESFAFIKNIKIDQLLMPVLYILFAIILLRLEKYYEIEVAYGKEKIYQTILNLSLFIALIFSISWIPLKHVLDNKDNEYIDTEFTLANSPLSVLSFYVNIYRSVNNYYTEKKELEVASHVTPPWFIRLAHPKYKNYVLIIGESARRDYLSTYGFKLPTSPFIDETNGYINTGYVSSAPATYHSFLHTFYLKIKKPKTNKQDYSYNIVTLAKAAGIKTFWLSNQGSIGKYDTIGSRLGMMSDVPYFTKKGAFNTSNEDDFKLVDKLDELLTNKTYSNHPRLFILHLMGSHNNFCDRLRDDENKYEFVNKDLSCYVNTILKTDNLIKNVITLLKREHESYSLMYFSDHGLSHTNKEEDNEDVEKKDLSLTYNSKFKQNYEVPYFKLSSDDSQRITVNVKRSALNFMYGFSQWLNIKTKELNKDYDFFSNKDDENIKVFNFEDFVPYDELKEDKIPDFADGTDVDTKDNIQKDAKN